MEERKPLPPSIAERARIYEEALGIKVEQLPEEEEHRLEPPREVVELARLYSARGYLRAALHLLKLAQAYAPRDLAAKIAKAADIVEETELELEDRLTTSIFELTELTHKRRTAVPS